MFALTNQFDGCRSLLGPRGKSFVVCCMMAALGMKRQSKNPRSSRTVLGVKNSGVTCARSGTCFVPWLLTLHAKNRNSAFEISRRGHHFVIVVVVYRFVLRFSVVEISTCVIKYNYLVIDAITFL